MPSRIMASRGDRPVLRRHLRAERREQWPASGAPAGGGRGESDSQPLAQPTEITVDLENARVEAAGLTLAFSIDPVWRTKLLNGWDDLDLTQSHAAEIRAFMERDALARPWMAPSRDK